MVVTVTFELFFCVDMSRDEALGLLQRCIDEVSFICDLLSILITNRIAFYLIFANYLLCSVVVAFVGYDKVVFVAECQQQRHCRLMSF